MIPLILKDSQIFIDGHGYAGRAQKVKLPKLSLKTEELWAGGMSGPIEIAMGHEKLEATVELFEWSPKVIELFGNIDHAGTGLRIMAALERDDGSEETVGVEVELRGRVKVIDHGDIEQGKIAPMTAEIAVSYYKYSHDGRELIEIDMTAPGGDLSAARRAAIGL